MAWIVVYLTNSVSSTVWTILNLLSRRLADSRPLPTDPPAKGKTLLVYNILVALPGRPNGLCNQL